MGGKNKIEHEIQRILSCSETVAGRLLNVFHNSHVVGKPVYWPNLIMNASCQSIAPYAVRATILPPPSKLHFCLMALYIIKGRKWSLEAFKDHRKINK